MGLDLAAWKVAAKAGEPPAELLHKQYTADSIKAEGDGKYSFTISTGAVDRDKDTVAVDGWSLDSYRRNPVVLFAHRYAEPPVGLAEAVLAKGGQLKARVKFAPADTYAFAETVRRLVDGGYLRATSVGFRALKWSFNEERGGVDFLEQELMEFSIVPVPANPEALIDAKSAGIDLAPLKDWAVRILDGVEPGLWLPKDVAARALKIASGEPVVVVPDPEPGEQKRGRTLSAANEGRIRSAKESLEAVLSSMPAEDDEEDDEPKGGATPVVKEPEPGEKAQPEPITAEQLSGLVTAALGAAVRRLQGRLED